MRLDFSPQEETFRREAATWLEGQLSGPFADLRTGRAHDISAPERRKEWERALGRARWSAIGWPEEYGGRNATLAEQVIFAEEYARARAPGRLGHLGIELCGPTILALGTEAQKRRFLPKMSAGEEYWCQGYSEPNAGSDLSNVRTRARLEKGPNGPEWVIEGQKTWTSLAQFADWCFLVTRTEEGSTGARGLSYLLVPMHQKGVTIRPIRQMTGEAEFNETFFDGARTAAENVVGAPGEGWKVAMATLSFERGASTLAQQMGFRNQLDAIIGAAKDNGAARDPLIRQRLAEAYAGLKIMRASSLRMLTSAQSGKLSPEAFTYKIFWATWHRKLGELAMDVLGPAGELGTAAPYELQELTKMFLFSRADTIYAGTNQVQRNIIAERALGLPKEPRGGA
ncbi:MAG: acyl-CoA dehydrogenase family protein [Gammaproteobacteria bacterium]|nr:acyl-CoA dehydrogenase family protein [Gammaproteobacteria bacterium]